RRRGGRPPESPHRHGERQPGQLREQPGELARPLRRRVGQGRGASRRGHPRARDRDAGAPGTGEQGVRAGAPDGAGPAGADVPRSVGGGAVPIRAAALILVAGLAGCAGTPEPRPFVAPEVIEVPVTRYVPVPAELTEPCP